MGNLSQGQFKAIRDFLTANGITYGPLQDEMVDHIGCDLERSMEEGNSYEASLQKVLHHIPSIQLQTLQLQTMETISKRPSLSTLFGYLSFFLLFAASIFKILHFPGAGELLISSFASIAMSLISGSIVGMYMYKARGGAWLLVAIVLSIILFLSSLTFQILHLPGATEIRTTAVLTLCTLFPFSFFYVREKTEQLLPYLHDKFTPRIARFIVILFCAASITRIILILTTGANDIPSRILLVVVIAAAGLHFFALTWNSNQKQVTTPIWHSMLLSIAFLCFMLPGLVGILSPLLRSIFSTGFFVLAGMYILSQQEGGFTKFLKSLSVGFVIAVQLAWALSLQEFISFGSFNMWATLILFALLIVHRKDAMMTMFLISFIAHYLFVYPSSIPY
jgi:hypothetical protein